MRNTLLSTGAPRAVRALGGLALAMGLGWTAPAAGQTFIPAGTKESFLTRGNAKGVTNTGCGQSTDGAHGLQVFTWDGPKASFGWDFAGAATGSQPLQAVLDGQKVQDPDIVSYCRGGRFFMAAVYLGNVGGADRAEYELQTYDPGANAWYVVTPPTFIDNGTGRDCSSPNLDVDQRNGNAVMTFLEDEVYVRALNIPSQTLYPLSRVTSSAAQQTVGQPDVALFEDPRSPGASVVSVVMTFAYTGPGGFQSLTLAQGTLADVQLGTPTPGLYFSGSSALFPLADQLDAPRIAAPSQIGNPDPHDCLIVVHHNDGSGDEIRSLTRYTAVTANLVDRTLNAPLTSRTAGSARPVVSYIGDGALVAWQYDDAGNGLLNNDRDVVGTWVHFDGSAASPAGDVLVANAQTAGNQFAPSVEGRYGTSNRMGVLAWHDETMADLAYKTLDWYQQPLRPSLASAPAPQRLAQGVGVYPNPAVGNSQAMVPLAAGEQPQAVDVVDARTGRVVAALPLAGLRAGDNALPLPSLATGLYLLRVQTSQGVRVTKFSAQP